jgi:hypothetical protein
MNNQETISFGKIAWVAEFQPVRILGTPQKDGYVLVADIGPNDLAYLVHKSCLHHIRNPKH